MLNVNVKPKSRREALMPVLEANRSATGLAPVLALVDEDDCSSTSIGTDVLQTSPLPRGLAPRLLSFQVKSKLGSGTFGTVFAAQRKNGETVAVKAIRKSVLKKCGLDKYDVIRERNLLCLLSRRSSSSGPATMAEQGSKFILGFEEAFEDAFNMYIITGYLSGGDLFSELRKHGGHFGPRRVKIVSAELVS